VLKTHPSYKLYATASVKPRCATYVSKAVSSVGVTSPEPYWVDVRVGQEVVTNVYLPPAERAVAEEFLTKPSRPR